MGSGSGTHRLILSEVEPMTSGLVTPERVRVLSVTPQPGDHQVERPEV
jgi:hypothetical protein